MNRVYLHSKNNVSSFLKVLLTFIILFSLYGIYKNSIMLLIKHSGNVIDALRPICYIVISLIISIIFSTIKKEKILSYSLILNLLISICTMPSLNIIIYTLLVILLNVVLIFKNINIVPIFMALSIIIDKIFFRFGFLNVYERTMMHDYSLIDYLVGKGPGGCGVTLILLSILAITILSFNINYKKHIPLMAFSTFYGLVFILSIIKGGVNLNILLNSNFIFSMIFICPLSLYSPYSKGGCYIFGLLMGIMTFVLSFIDLDLSVYISIIALSLLSKIIDKYVVYKK